MATPNKTREWSPQQILDVLNSSTSSYSAAQVLGVSEYTLWRYMRQHNIIRICRYEISQLLSSPADNPTQDAR